MWLLALAQGPTVVIYDGSKTERKQFPDFGATVNFMLKEGWEPFAADSGNAVMVWFRKKTG